MTGSLISGVRMIMSAFTRINQTTFSFKVPPSGNWTAYIVAFSYQSGSAMAAKLIVAQRINNDLYVSNNIQTSSVPTEITQNGDTVTVTIAAATSFRGHAIVFF